MNSDQVLPVTGEASRNSIYRVIPVRGNPKRHAVFDVIMDDAIAICPDEITAGKVRDALDRLATRPSPDRVERLREDLADAFEVFWNAALVPTHDYQDSTANAVMSGMVSGFAAMAKRLREPAALAQEDAPAIPEAGKGYTVVAQPQIPEGMVPWHGGDSAPEDWDGGDVICRDGGLGTSADTDEWFWGHDNRPWDIIAYTPKSATPRKPATSEADGK